jgi:hypothetical protein
MDYSTENCTRGDASWEIIEDDNEEVLVESEDKLNQMNQLKNDLLMKTLQNSIKTLQKELLLSRESQEDKDLELKNLYDVIKSKEKYIQNNERKFSELTNQINDNDNINNNLKKLLDDKDIEVDKLLKFSSDLNFNETQYRKEIKYYIELIEEKDEDIHTLVEGLENKALQARHYDNLLETLTHRMNIQCRELDIIKKKEEANEEKKHFLVKFNSQNTIGLTICSNALQSSINDMSFVSEISQNSEAFYGNIYF